MSGIVFIILGIYLITYMSIRMDKNVIKDSKAISLPPEKLCPPHPWKFEDQPGVEGAVFIRCQKCGMIPGRDLLTK